MLKLKKILSSIIGLAFIGGFGIYGADEVTTYKIESLSDDLKLKVEKEKILESKEINGIVEYDYISKTEVDKDIKDNILFNGKDQTTNAVKIKEGTIRFYTGGDSFFKDIDGKIYNIEKKATTTKDAFDLQTTTTLLEELLSFYGKETLAACGDDGGICYGSAADDCVYKFFTPTTLANWNTARAAASGDGVYGATYAYTQPMVRIYGNEGGSSFIMRASHPVDTSLLPDDATITAALFKAYVQAKTDNQNDGYDYMVIVEGNSAMSTLDVGDYDLFGTTKGSDSVDIGTITTGGYNTWTLNSTGYTWISKTGTTYLGVREGHDVDDVFWDDDALEDNQISITSADYTGTTRDPYLEINFTTGGAAEEPRKLSHPQMLIY